MSAKPYMKVAILGVGVILLSVISLFVYPQEAPWLPEGFSSPIIAFEFVESPQEVSRLFGLQDEARRAQMIRRMDRGNQLDILYMILYSSFLGGFALTCARETGVRWFYVGAGLAGLMLISDFLENLELFGIAAHYATGDISAELAWLHIFTWIKWGSLALFFLAMVPYFSKGFWFAKLIAILSLVPAVAAVIACNQRSVWNELMVYSIGLMFLLLILYCFIYRSLRQAN